jgi:hypothetical protein
MSKSHDEVTLVYTLASVAFPLAIAGVSDEEIEVSFDDPHIGTFGQMNWQFKTFGQGEHGVQMRVFGNALECLFDPRIQRVVERWRSSGLPDELTPAELLAWLAAEGVGPSKYQILGEIDKENSNE